MTNLTYGRVLMGSTLGLHIVLAVLGMALPLYISLAEGLGIWRHNDLLLLLARRWSAAFTILFAVGAATGVIVAFELSLLWPAFMAIAGQAIALPFAIEGFAFLFEAIFLGIYVYGWDRFTNPVLALALLAADRDRIRIVGPAHYDGQRMDEFARGFSAGAWQGGGRATDRRDAQSRDTQRGVAHTHHRVSGGRLRAGGGYRAGDVARAPWALLQTGAGVCDARLASGWPARRCLLAICPANISSHYQPAKLAAAEALYHTQAYAPEDLGLFKIPGLLSFLSTGNPSAKVLGLDAFTRAEQPSPVTHLAFLAMVAIGMYLATLAAAYALALWKRHDWAGNVWMLRAIALATPLGFCAIEAGWEVTELGRQPWIIYHFMTVNQALTTSPYVPVMFWTFLPLYVIISALTAFALLRYFRTHPLPVPAVQPGLSPPTRTGERPRPPARIGISIGMGDGR